jgi:actin
LNTSTVLYVNALLTFSLFTNDVLQAVYLAASPVMSLCACARVTGTVLQSGAGATHAVSIYEGKMIQDSCIRMETNGNDIDDFLRQEFKGNGNLDTIGTAFSLSSDADGELKTNSSIDRYGLDLTIRSIKENLCYTSLGYSEELSNPIGDIERSFELPDKRTISVQQERFRCSEVLFQPKLIGKEELGIHQILDSSIKNAPKS